MNNVLLGKTASAKMLEELEGELSKLDQKLKLVVLQIGDNEASNLYIKHKQRKASELGIDFEHIKYDEKVSEDEVINKIVLLNEDKDVTGIILQLPIPERFNKEQIINYINSYKDVDGLTDINQAKLTTGGGIVPCTPLGIMRLLDHYEIDMENKQVVIIGRSKLVGGPLINLCHKKGAIVTVCHSGTEDLKAETLKADILISATGVPHLITEDMVKDDIIVIDVGVNREGTTVIGDVHHDVYKKVRAYTPTIGGVGPMTVASLMCNILNCHKLQK